MKLSPIINNLEKIANKATPGPWVHMFGTIQQCTSYNDPMRICCSLSPSALRAMSDLAPLKDAFEISQSKEGQQNYHDMRFISEFNPEVVKELIRVFKEHQRDRRSVKKINGKIIDEIIDVLEFAQDDFLVGHGEDENKVVKERFHKVSLKARDLFYKLKSITQI